jgi:arylsulfatase A-like enzyme
MKNTKLRLAILLLLSAAATQAAPPNVLFIAVDDLRPQLGCYGEDFMVTPHIDTLASKGRLFRNHYVAVPICAASRYAMMTGLRPTPATDFQDVFDLMPTSLPAEPESWADLLRRNGWHTVSLGKITHEPDGFRWDDSGTYDIGRYRATNPDMRHSWNEILYDHDKWGAQRYPLFAYADGTGRVQGVSSAWESGVDGMGNSLPDEAYPEGQMAQAAIEKLREFADDGTRFCLALGFYKPHLPFNAPKAYYDLYDPATLPGPDPAGKPAGANNSTVGSNSEITRYSNGGDFAQLRHAYFACVSYVDAQVGKVLAELEALGLADNTIVLFWGDHGFCLGEYGGAIAKAKPLEHSVGSPLIIRPPASLRPEVFAGVHAEGVVATIDIYPTIAELCGLTPPASTDGSSLVPMLRNPFAPGKNHAYSRISSMTTVRTSDWRLIDTNGDKDLYDLSTFRYELADVSGSNPGVVSDLSAGLTTQGTRSGTTYEDWAADQGVAGGFDGDHDGDGCPNGLEYGAGTDAKDPSSYPAGTLTFEDLTSGGLSDREIVFSFPLATSPNDLTLVPSTSTDLENWHFPPLEFLEAVVPGPSAVRLRFRLTDKTDPSRFFRFGGSTD